MDGEGGAALFHACKISVVKRMHDPELADAYLAKPERLSLCDRVFDGQEFYVNNPYEMPEGICPSAWADIRTYLIAIASGGEFAFMKDKHSILVSCTDLFRPVIFKIERLPPSG